MPKQTTSEDIAFHVVITVKQENNGLNDVMAAFNGVQKPDKMRVYYPKSVPGAAAVDCLWNRMDTKDIERVKNIEKSCLRKSV